MNQPSTFKSKMIPTHMVFSGFVRVCDVCMQVCVHMVVGDQI